MAGDLYLHRSSPMHRLHPVTKIVLLLLMLATPFCAEHPLYVAVPFAIAAALALIAGAARTLWRVRWLILVFFVLSMVLWSLFTRDGDPLWTLGGLSITRKGLLFGLSVGLRLNTFFLAAIAVLSSTPNEDLVFALGRIGLPYPFAFAISLSFRLVPLFLETVSTVSLAQRARGLDLESGNFIVRARRHVPVLLPVLFLAILRTNRLAMALESKGFGATGKRTRLAEHKIKAADMITALLMALLAVAGALVVVHSLGGL
ncbi:MAG: energy-coupling factor transporter transmembrane component T [Candidatus Alcyoniella australis]|nr:energy-coupling factor transporter transmembrane component T [Candidatus Alcyoniella australis]